MPLVFNFICTFETKEIVLHSYIFLVRPFEVQPFEVRPFEVVSLTVIQS